MDFRFFDSDIKNFEGYLIQIEFNDETGQPLYLGYPNRAASCISFTLPPVSISDLDRAMRSYLATAYALYPEGDHVVTARQSPLTKGLPQYVLDRRDFKILRQ